MEITQHARILNAYISRLPLSALEDIFNTQRKAWQASLNSSLSEQCKTQEEAASAIYSALGTLISHDKDNIEFILKDII